MKPLERTILRFSAYALILFIVATLIAPIFASGYPAAPRRCYHNIKRQTFGLVLYADDSDSRFAMRDVWMDAIQPYVKDEFYYHDLDVPKGAYGYAFNAALSGAKTPRHPERAPMVYDSVNPIRNASDPFKSLPNPGRHGGKNTIGYADGHAKRASVGGLP